MQTAYSEEQFELNYPDGVEDHYWNLARNAILAAEIRRLAGPGSPVLDVGCGRGIVLKHLREQGIDCAGVELAVARPLEGLDAYIRFGTDALDLPAAERSKYKVLLLLDVLEHLPDPAAFLTSLLRAFSAAAHLVITVPARAELWSNYDDFFGHHRRYTLDMIEDLARQLGAQVTWQRYFFRPLYLPLRLLSKLGVKRSLRTRGPRGIMKYAHRIVARFLVLEHRLSSGTRPGGSIIAVLSPGPRP